MRTLTYAPDAWKYLNGIFCVYKSPKFSLCKLRDALIKNLCRDLNDMEKRSPRDLVLIKGSITGEQPLSVEVVPNYADHEFVTGSRYQLQDIRMKAVGLLGINTSGVLLVAVNDGCKKFEKFGCDTFLRKYEVKGKFGLASKNFMDDGIVVERSTYSQIRRASLDKLLASIQFSHQALAYKYSGIDMSSQAAYELASKGVVRPFGTTVPIIYGIKCSQFMLPEFTLEIHSINETEAFLAELVHQIGIYLKCNAVCTGLRRTHFGRFSTDTALLRKHWTLEHILSNITLCSEILDGNDFMPSSPQLEVVKSSHLKEKIKDMQNEMREEVL